MSTPDPNLAGAGLSATGKTADEFEPGDPGPGTTYGAPGGTGAEGDETTEGEKAPEDGTGETTEDDLW